MAGIKFFKAAFGAYKKPKAMAHSKQPIIRCSGTPPSPLSEQFSTNYDRTFNFDSHDENEFDHISYDEACSTDYTCDDDVEEMPLPSYYAASIQTPATHGPTKRRSGKASQKTVASTSEVARKETFQPPPSDNESSDNETDDESEDGSDDWTAICLDANGNPCEKPASTCQKSGSASDCAEACYPRVHVLFAAKYGDFLKRQPQNVTLTAR